jgi:hypothetical protein
VDTIVDSGLDVATALDTGQLDSGTSDSSVPTDSGASDSSTVDSTIPPSDSGGIVDAGPQVDSAMPCTGTATLYERLGCEAGITSAVNAIFGAELANGDIASYFAYVGTPGHPNVDQIEACFVKFLSSAVGGPDAYPTTVTAGGSSFMCRPMATAHADLYISGGSFDTFVSIAGSVLMSPLFNVSASDVAMIAGVLGGYKPMIVPSYLTDAGLETLSQGIRSAQEAGVDAYEQ